MTPVAYGYGDGEMTKTLTNHRSDGCYSLAFIVEELKNALTDTAAVKDEKLSVWKEHQKKKKESEKLPCHRKREGSFVGIVALLKECAKNKDLQRGLRAHAEISKSGMFKNNTYIANTLISMYAKCGDIKKAKEVLFSHPSRNVVSWSALIAGYAQEGLYLEALQCVEEMELEGISPDEITFTCILKACGNAKAIEKGEKIHEAIVRRGFLLWKNVVLSTALVDMYGKCSTFSRAWEVIEEVLVRNVVTWSALISGYVQHGHGEKALHCYELMQLEGIHPNSVTFICILQACGGIRSIEKGKEIHRKIAREGWIEKDAVLGTALVDMYVKCGALSKARLVLDNLPFRSIATWSAMIGGYAKHELGEDALYCFDKMQLEGNDPNVVTFTCIIKACGTIGEVEKGEKIHNEIVRKGYLENNIVLGTALMDMYVRCGYIEKAAQVHDELSVRDIVCWNTLIGGYAQQGKEEDALICLNKLQYEGLSPDAVTLACILKACGHMGASEKGAQIHDKIIRQDLQGREETALTTALVHMYAKCGAIEKARDMLDRLHVKNIFLWSSLISGYAQRGQAQEALSCFEQMLFEGFLPNSIIFGCVLNACSHSGLVDEGEMHFTDMRMKYGIEPDLEHYTCMVDLFGRAGCFDKAMAIIEKMPLYDYRPTWSALLNACHQWGNVRLGRLAFKHAVQIDSGHIGAYVCMSNIYAACGIRDGIEMIG